MIPFVSMMTLRSIVEEILVLNTTISSTTLADFMTLLISKLQESAVIVEEELDLGKVVSTSDLFKRATFISRMVRCPLWPPILPIQ